MLHYFFSFSYVIFDFERTFSTMKMKSEISIPQVTYQRLLEHLQIHAPTDSWASSLLEELQQEAKPAYLLPSGSYLLDSEVDAEYRVN
jgi:hypothetical protein